MDIRDLNPGSPTDPAYVWNQVAWTVGQPAGREGTDVQALLAETAEARAKAVGYKIEADQKSEVINDLWNAIQKLLKQTIHDKLTGAYNRAYFDEELESVAEDSHRREASYGLLFIDADKFKDVNDKYGHQFGDAVLIELARRLKACQRRANKVCRYGGEEFAVILPNCDSPESAMIAAERVRRAVADKPFEIEVEEKIDGNIIKRVVSIDFTISIGVAHHAHGTAETASDSIKQADTAVYVAKGRGRNRSILYGKAETEQPQPVVPETPPKIVGGSYDT